MPWAIAGRQDAHASSATASMASQRRPKGLAFSEEGVIEAVVVIVGNELPSPRRIRGRACPLGVGIRGEKCFHGRIVFFPENRAGCVEQFTTRFKDLPQIRQKRHLLLRKAQQVRWATVPADIRVPPGDAGSGAGGVQKHRLVRLAVPPIRRLAGVAGDQLGIQAQAVEILADPVKTALVDIEGSDIGIGQLEQVGRLAARSGASIQYSFAVPRPEQYRGVLCSGVLNADSSLRESGNVGDRAGLDPDGPVAHSRRRDSCGCHFGEC